ncbi:hypothetical protein FACS189454_05150 [Planctomycetales bacterium]|nr:hypothetical protein FACS189454_05150 [Planctomycetales bacterium]
MPNFFYFDNNGTKQGPYDGVQLTALAKNGNVTPDTLVENEAGKQTKAKNITGLFPHPVPPPTSEVDFLDIGFTRFITPVWISTIWIICIVVDVISVFISFVYAVIIANTVKEDTNNIGVDAAVVFILGLLASIILPLLTLLLQRIVLEVLIVLFKIEKNTRETEENTRQGIASKQQ